MHFGGMDSVYACISHVCVCRDIPVDMKYVAEPHMHSMPAVTVHPNGEYVTCSLSLSLSLSHPPSLSLLLIPPYLPTSLPCSPPLTIYLYIIIYAHTYPDVLCGTAALRYTHYVIISCKLCLTHSFVHSLIHSLCIVTYNVMLVQTYTRHAQASGWPVRVWTTKS